MEDAKALFERLVNHFSQSNDNIKPLIDSKEQSLYEYGILHTRMMAAKSRYLNCECQHRVTDFWNYIYSLYYAELKNVCKIFEATIVSQVNICTCERIFGLRKLILSPRRSRLDSETVSWILRIKLNSCDCHEFDKCKYFYQRCVYYFKDNQIHIHLNQNESQ